VKRRRRRAAALALVLLVLFLVGLGVDELLHSSFLSVRRIAVVGGPASLASASGVALGTPLLDVSPAAVAARLLRSDPWLGAVQVERVFPSELLLQVVPRTVVALVEARGGQVLGIDATGRLLPVGTGALAAYPYLAGVTVPDRPFAPAPRAERLQSELRLVVRMPQGLRSEVAEVDVQGARQELVLSSGTRVLLGRPVLLRQKLQVLGLILEKLRALHRTVAEINVEDPTAPDLVDTP
jgi:cell division protein FtsQ